MQSSVYDASSYNQPQPQPKAYTSNNSYGGGSGGISSFGGYPLEQAGGSSSSTAQPGLGVVEPNYGGASTGLVLQPHPQ